MLVKQLFNLSILSICFASSSYAMQSEDLWKQYAELTALTSEINYLSDDTIMDKVIAFLEEIIQTSSSLSDVIKAKVELATMLSTRSHRMSHTDQALDARINQLFEEAGSTPDADIDANHPLMPLYYMARALLSIGTLQQEMGNRQQAQRAYARGLQFVRTRIPEALTMPITIDPATGAIAVASLFAITIQGLASTAEKQLSRL